MSVPVRETALRAYGFAGRRALPLIGLGWLTAVFYFAATAYFLGRLSATMLVWPRPDAGSFNNFALFYLFCLVIVSALANAVMSVSLTREALTPSEEWKTAHFSVARREWSLFVNLVLLYSIVIGIVTGIIFAANVGIAVATPMIGHGGVWKGIDLPPLMSALSVVIAVAAGLFLAIRFGFFTGPMAVAEPPVRLLHAWTLSRGNFWRLLTVSLAVVFPVLLLWLAVEWAVLGSQFTQSLGAVLGDSRDNTAFFQMLQDHAVTIAAIWAGALLVLNAIFAGASADAYREVEHDVEPAREYVTFAEPAMAFAAPAAAVAAVAPIAESKRIEPAFVKEDEKPAATGSSVTADTGAGQKVVAKVAEAPETMAVIDVAKVEAPLADAKEVSADEASTDKALTANDPIASVAEYKKEAAETETQAEAASPADAATEADSEAPLPADADVSHAEHEAVKVADAPLEAPTTPLPSFVRPQASPPGEPSEAA